MRPTGNERREVTKKEIGPLCSGGIPESGVLHSALDSPQGRKDTDLLKQAQRGNTKLIGGTEHLSLQRKVKRLGFVQPEKGKA